MAKGSYRGVVVRFAPFAKDIRQTKYVDTHTLRTLQIKKCLLCSALTRTVRIVSIYLSRGRVDDRNLSPRPSDGVAKAFCQLLISGSKLLRVLRPINTCQMENKVNICQQINQMGLVFSPLKSENLNILTLRQMEP